jgi:CYTH domain-containing protein
MAKEIERRFKLGLPSVLVGRTGRLIVQGYLNFQPVTRVRIYPETEEACLTIKGPRVGMECDEFEYPIPIDDARQMLAMCGQFIVEKTRYEVVSNGHTFEVDVCHKRHEGLHMVELELPNASTSVLIPDWVGEEITGDHRYSNAYLAQHDGIPA